MRKEYGPGRFLHMVFLLGMSIVLLFVVAHAQAMDPSAAQQKITSQGGHAALLDRVQRDGSVRLIINLGVPYKPMGLLKDVEARSQVDSIAKAQSEIYQSLSGHYVDYVWNFKYVPQMAVTVDRSALDLLVAHPSVVSIEEDVPVPYTLDLSVPRIGAPALWNQGYTGAGVVVAILDTGVDKTHPFLNGSVLSEACYSSSVSSQAASSVCPGGATDSTDVDSAMPYGGNCAVGDCDHGTHVCGIAAGRDNGSFSGVAKGVGIIAIQIFSRFDDSAACNGQSHCALAYTSDQIKGLERVYELRSTYNIAAINMSLGGGLSSVSCDSDSRKPYIDNLRSANIATVIASGNTGYKSGISYPACISSAVSVGATDDFDAVAGYSNSSSLLNLLAPGSSINSSIPGSCSGGCYASWSGTSMATPHVTGSWALLRQARPNATVDQVKNALASTGLGITDTNGITKPRIRVDQALTALGGNTCTYTINPSLSDIAASGGGTGATAVTTQSGCSWAVSNNLGWVTIISGSSGTGNGTINYSISANSSASARSGSITIAGVPYIVQQNGTTCSYSLSPTVGMPISGSGGTGSFTVTTQNGCDWAVSENLDWVTITSGGSGVGNGTVQYSVLENPRIIPRSGTLSINGSGIIITDGFMQLAQQSGNPKVARIGVFRKGNWYINYSGEGAWHGCGTTINDDRCYSYGMAGDIPVVGDWSGGGTSEIGVFRNGWWYLNYPGTGIWVGCGAPGDPTKDACIPFGVPSDIPVVGNWNGSADGKSKIGVFRNGTWYLDYPGTGIWVGCGAPGDPAKDICIPFGIDGDTPVVGDWNGDGKAKIGVLRGGTLYLDFNGNGSWDGCGAPGDPTKDACYNYGMSSDKPIGGLW
jgi:subtilisin family serine protease